MLGLRGRHQCSDQPSNRNRASCVASNAVGPNGQIVSVKKAANRRRQSGRKIIDEEREKYRVKNGSLRNTSTDSKRTTFVMLINHASAPIRKKRLSPTSKARREVSLNQFEEKVGMPDRVKSFREIDSR